MGWGVSHLYWHRGAAASVLQYSTEGKSFCMLCAGVFSGTRDAFHVRPGCGLFMQGAWQGYFWRTICFHFVFYKFKKRCPRITQEALTGEIDLLSKVAEGMKIIKMKW